MDPKCRAAVQAAAAGRKISDKKLDEIERALRDHMRRLASQDVARWRTLTTEQRVMEAATRAMYDIKAEAARKEHNAALQVLRAAETDARVQRQQSSHAGATRTEALNADMQQAENRVQAVRNESISMMTDVLDAAASSEGVGFGRRVLMFLFGVDNPRMTADMVREVFKSADGSTGNATAQKAARAWLDTIEQMRQRFNAAGGDIGKLDYGYLSQIHDQMKVLGKGDGASRDAWVERVMPLLNRQRYLAEDGTLMTDDAVRDLLRSAWQTISTGGDNKTAPGAFKGTGARANRGSDARVLHFADGDAWMAYMKDFGEGSLYDAMVGHVSRLARDIALVEQYGPNPAQTVRTQADIARRMDRQVGVVRRELTTNKPMTLWNLISGNAGAPESATLARFGSGLRNVQTAAKITAGPLAAFGDMATIATTLHYNRLPWFDMVRNLKGMNAEQRAFLTQHGVIAESLLGDIHRFTGDTFTHDWTGRATSAVMKLSLLNAWTDSLRRAFSATMMQNFASKLGKAWGELDEWDRTLMQRKGIGEDEWSVISRAQPVERDGRQYLTATAIRGVDPAAVADAVPENMRRIQEAIAAKTAALMERNKQDQEWIKGRLDKFDDARDSMNRWVKQRAARRDAKNQEATGSMLQRMALLDAQREQAQLHADMEADFNRFVTQDDVRSFLNAVEDGASADLADVGRGGARSEVRRGLESAEAIGRRYGQAKGQLERRMREIESRIVAMDRQAGRAADADAKVAQNKADSMADDLKAFIARSEDRQQRRAAVIERLRADEAPRLLAEADRLRSDAATKWVAFVNDEAQFAVVNPDLATRAVVTAGAQQAGTWTGEVARSMAQFKSFPAAMITRHWRRILDTPQGLEGAPAGFRGETASGELANKVGMLAAMMVTATLLGAIQTQGRQVMQGKDPIDMTGDHALKFWAKAFAAGGGSGFFGDVLLAPADDPSFSFEGRLGLFGPVAGAAGGLIDIAKDKHHAARAAKWVNDQLPGVDIWYLRALWEHSVLHNSQEALNPGYLGRMQRRAQKDWGQDWWWTPGELAPDRAPDMLGAVGVD